MKIKRLGRRENRYFGIAEIYMNKNYRYYNPVERVFTDDDNFESGYFGNYKSRFRRKKYKMRRDAFYLGPKTTRAFRRILRRMGKDKRNIGVIIRLTSSFIDGATLFGVVKGSKKKNAKQEKCCYPQSNRLWIQFGEMTN